MVSNKRSKSSNIASPSDTLCRGCCGPIMSKTTYKRNASKRRMLTQIDPKRLRTSLASLSNETPDSDTNTLDKTRCFFLRKKATSSLSWRPTGTTSSFTVYYCFTFTHTIHFASTDFSLIFNVLVYNTIVKSFFTSSISAALNRVCCDPIMSNGFMDATR